MRQYMYELQHLFFNEENCISCLIDNDILYKQRICSCGNAMKLNIGKQKFVCNLKKCRKSVTIRANSFFAGCRLPYSKILLIGYIWLCKSPVSCAISISGCSSHTICEFYYEFRELVSNIFETEDTSIGGENIIVEVDESKLGKRKYNRGHKVEGVWVVGGIERTDERKAFIVQVQNRTK